MIRNLVFARTAKEAKNSNVSFFISEKDGKRYYSYVVRNIANNDGVQSNVNKNGAQVLETNTMKSEKSYEMENVILSFVSFDLLRQSLFSKFGLFAVLENNKLKVCGIDQLDNVDGILKPKENAVYNNLEELADAAYANPFCEICGNGYIQFVQSYFDESGLDGLKFQQLKTAAGEVIARDTKTGLWRVLGAKDKMSADEMPVFRAWQILTERAEHKVWTPRSIALTTPVAETHTEGVSIEQLQGDPQSEQVEL